MTKTTPRLFVERQLVALQQVTLSDEGAHYLRNVLRLAPGDAVRLFNGTDGEWLCHATEVSKKRVEVRCERALAAASPPPDIDYLFAPLKHARLDYMIQKATELGARRLIPVMTQRTIVDRVNLDRMRANAVEAAEQCNLVFVPSVEEPKPLGKVLEQWDPARSLVFCDESGGGQNPLAGLRHVRAPAAVLVGPEGGFTPDEQQILKRQPYVIPISLGPRIMRADTAAIASLTLVQAIAGDW